MSKKKKHLTVLPPPVLAAADVPSIAPAADSWTPEEWNERLGNFCAKIAWAAEVTDFCTALHAGNLALRFGNQAIRLVDVQPCILTPDGRESDFTFNRVERHALWAWLQLRAQDNRMGGVVPILLDHAAQLDAQYRVWMERTRPALERLDGIIAALDAVAAEKQEPPPKEAMQ